VVRRIPAGALARYLAGLYRAAGMTGQGSAAMAADQIEADLRGITSHGSRLAPGYLAKLRAGRLNPRPHLGVLADDAGCLALDADLAPGPLAARAAVHAAVIRARGHGVGLVTVRGAGHAGALGVYASRVARRGLIGFVAAQTSSASLALHGGTRAVLGNSAVAIAIPTAARGRPVLLDTAAAAMSWGRVGQAARAGQLLPPGCALDRHGNATTDPAQAVALLPAGGRGQALAIVTELLVGPLTASSPLPAGQDGRGLLCLAISPAHLRVAEHLSAGVQQVAYAVRGVGGARMPGDRAWAHRAESTTRGIPLGEEEVCALLTAAESSVRTPPALAGHYDTCPHHQTVNPTVNRRSDRL
jgi:LDH2 family malate/lactate/ureidoglycolate dehydrogenase